MKSLDEMSAQGLLLVEEGILKNKEDIWTSEPEPLFPIKFAQHNRKGRAGKKRKRKDEEKEKIKENDYETDEKGLPIHQEFLLDTIVHIEGRIHHPPLQALFLLLSILTIGLYYLLARWFPRLLCVMTTKQCPLSKASHIFIKNGYGQVQFLVVNCCYYGDGLDKFFGVDSLQKDGIQEGSEEWRNDREQKEFKREEMFEEVELLLYNKLEQTLASPRPSLLSYPHPISLRCLTKQQISFGHKPSDYLYYFEYQYARYLYNPYKAVFVENSELDPMRDVTFEMLNNGINKEEALRRHMIYGLNAINIEKKSFFSLFIEEILHPFNVFQVFSILIWCLDEYFLYASTILIMSTFSSVTTIFETKRNIENLCEMARHQSILFVFRSGKWETIGSEELVPGDKIQINMEETDLASCDSMILEGGMCLVNESMLTGESIPVSKEGVDEDIWENGHNATLKNEKHILHAGTKLIRLRTSPAYSEYMPMTAGPSNSIGVNAIVLRTGFNTTKGNLIRSMIYPRPTSFKFYRDAIRFVLVLSSLATFAFLFTIFHLIQLGKSAFVIFLRACDLVTVVVPPALPATMAIGVAFAMSRLKSKEVYCISPGRINICGKLSMFVFDKTGTLTEEGLDVLGIHICNHNEENEDIERNDLELNASHLLSPSISPSLSDLLDHISSIPSSPCYSTMNFYHPMVCALATCHSLKKVNGKVIGDPLDTKMFEFARWELEDMHQSCSGSGTAVATIVRPGKEVNLESESYSMNEFQDTLSTTSDFTSNSTSTISTLASSFELGLIRCFEFNSNLRRQSVLVKAFKGHDIVTFVKGSPEGITSICLPHSLPPTLPALLHHYTLLGYRVIALAYKKCPKDWNWLKAQKVRREEVESNLTFLGFLIFENRVKKETKPVLESLKKGKFRSVMCTGDNLLTAVSVAKECRIVEPDFPIYLSKLSPSSISGDYNILWECMTDPSKRLNSSLKPVTVELRNGAEYLIEDDSLLTNRSGGGLHYALACTGDLFDEIFTQTSPIYLDKILLLCQVFARFSPEQKQRLVEALQRLDYCVGFCGDGANDCGALKVADVGVSLSEAEASVAAPFTCKRPDIRCVLDMIKEGRSALVTSFSCFKFMALYSLIQFTTISILYVYGSNLGDAQFLYIDLFIIIPIALCIGRFPAGHNITSRRPSANLMSNRVLLSILGQIFLQTLFQISVFLILETRNWYEKIPPVGEGTNVSTVSMLNTVLFLSSTFLYLVVAIIYSWNSPFQKPFYKNVLFMTVISILTVCSLVLLLLPYDFITKFFGLVPIPFPFRLFLLLLIFLYTVIAFACNAFVFPWMIRFSKYHSIFTKSDSTTNCFGRRPTKKKLKKFKLLIEELSSNRTVSV